MRKEEMKSRIEHLEFLICGDEHYYKGSKKLGVHINKDGSTEYIYKCVRCGKRNIDE